MSLSVRSCLLSLVLVLLTAILLVFPAKAMGYISEGLTLWATCVLPASLPFLFLSSLLSRGRAFQGVSRRLAPLMGKLFSLSGEGGCAAVLAALSGYPVGAKTVSELRERGRVSEGECFRLACLSTTCGPVFLIGTVGSGMLARPIAGAALFLSHLFAVGIVCLFLRGKKSNLPVVLPPVSEEKNVLQESLLSSVISSLCVGASIALFHALGGMLTEALWFLPEEGLTVLNGLVEMTSGCSIAATLPSPLSLFFCAFFVTFGGACVLVQQFAYLSRAGVKAVPFLAVKAVQGLIAGGLAFLFGLLYP